MRNFIILIDEKEGSSALISMLENFATVSTVHFLEGTASEPFDQHACGAISRKNLRKCLEMIYDEAPIDIEALNRIYRKTADASIAAFDKDCSVGFKMRFTPQQVNPLRKFPIRWVRETARRAVRSLFKRTMFSIFREYDVVVFVAVRQDIFRWALSRYHGDGSGRVGHLQFELANGGIQRSDIKDIRVDSSDFENMIEDCRGAHQRKKRLVEKLRDRDIDTYPLFYEDFLSDKHNYFRQLLGLLEIDVSDREIEAVLNEGTRFEKVHSEDIADFVENHEEIETRFGHEFVRWK